MADMRDALVRVADWIMTEVGEDGGCPICDSSPHPDGSISHDEDCFVPGVEKALAGGGVNTETVEMVARAIWSKMPVGWGVGCFRLWHEEPAEKQEQFRVIARAAIEAITRTDEDDGRDISGETVMGMRVAAYRETHPEHGDKYGHSYSEHWSTPTKSPAVKVERLFTEEQVRARIARTDEVVRLREALGAWMHLFTPTRDGGRDPLLPGWGQAIEDALTLGNAALHRSNPDGADNDQR
jgi:hypothetical protein